MDVAHRKDSHTERLCRDAARAIDAVLADENHIGQKDIEELAAAAMRLRWVAGHIVAVWG